MPQARLEDQTRDDKVAAAVWEHGSNYMYRTPKGRQALPVGEEYAVPPKAVLAEHPTWMAGFWAHL
eukprot:CAMPEP_0204212772 /NCGR_PEP_ID=MMETSP0361-20130328/75480_1 /ASSEMBLY_ACC=CAM_ASM_000343 /TAXON_ID=268821 /ORGANISM="Scrippsiella Hangoei, Strain SHTV-5" /LENGTH=65 /DNA_ID=CAMNT_0051177145 /DNA_START=15 /DNA_END=211 /DNA_ORIENTATION=+